MVRLLCRREENNNDQEPDREVDGVERRQADDGRFEEGRRDEQVDDNGNREEDIRRCKDSIGHDSENDSGQDWKEHRYLEDVGENKAR